MATMATVATVASADRMIAGVAGATSPTSSSFASRRRHPRLFFARTPDGGVVGCSVCASVSQRF
jgi:hypothetical protein